MIRPGLAALRVALGVCALAGLAGAQYVNDNSGIPNEGSNTENIDFGDVDLDGDWDAALADGGDTGNDQNRLWINQGGLQGGVEGVFSDETAAQFPVLADDSRDIEFLDIEGDGDLDIYTSNTAQISNQGNRWWINQGGAQGGALGFFTDETGSRWVGLNSASSSIASTLLLPDSTNPETFIDWSCDCDFADMDNDGDLDLFHSTYGGSFGGAVPSRIFLNDGNGFFEEFNPSGFKLSGTNLASGDPGIWCEGVQQSNTSDSTGARCDVTNFALDIDLGDLDGDFDIDVLHGSRESLPRLYQNRFEENGGFPTSLAFRDVSAAWFPPGYSSGGGNYEQELGDFDSDGDLDIYGLNWIGFTDVVMTNDGSGVFTNLETLPGSGADDNEGDFLDYDNDGDLDLFVANFSGSNKLYHNQLVETGSVDYFITQSGLGGGTSLDADGCDVDGDGDTDVFVGQDNFASNDALINTTDVPDAIPASIPHVEAVVGAGAQSTDDVVRAHVYDNAPYYITWYNDTRLHVSVDGIGLPAFPMLSSGGQIFRGAIPGNLVGDVEYTVRSTDEMGNTGVSAPSSYTNTGPTGYMGGGSSDSSVGTPTLRSLTRPLVGQHLFVVAENVAPGTAGMVLASLSKESALNLGDGVVLNVGPLLVDPIFLVANGDGESLLSVNAASPSLSGMTLHLQYIGADGAGGSTWASTRRLSLAFL